MIMTEKLIKAREYEEQKEKTISKEQRPLFHLTPRCGWMNDPNGFCFYKGSYHLFYYYFPYNTIWGPMHWGHAKSRDLISWEYLPAALAPDEDYDKDGCFSGSALALEDGRHLLIYTGVRKERDENGEEKETQTQCIALGDGINYEKYSGNPVITSDLLPKGAGKVDFRDPKIFRENGRYSIVVGNKTEDKDGQLLRFSSGDALNWSYDGLLIKNGLRYGIMWECPDYFTLDGRQVLLVSPQDMQAQGFDFHSGNGTLCLIGAEDDSGCFKEEHFHTIDHGMDFYAPQTVLAEDGRRIMIGWLQNWDTLAYKREDLQWFGQMSLPREISIKDDRLIQKPVSELENYYGKSISRQGILLEESTSVPGIKGRCLDMTLTIRSAEPGLSYRRFEIRFAQKGSTYSSIEYDPEENTVRADRSHSGSRRAILHERACRVSDRKGTITLRLILDRFSAELFINEGEQVMSMIVLTDKEAEEITFITSGKALMDVTMHELGRQVE